MSKIEEAGRKALEALYAAREFATVHGGQAAHALELQTHAAIQGLLLLTQMATRVTTPFADWPREADLLAQAIQRLNSTPYTLMKEECLQVLRDLRDAQAQQPYTDSTPGLSVGDSTFESWFSTYNPAGKGDKQRYRDAYAAGMGDPMVTAAPAQQPDLRERLHRRFRELGYTTNGQTSDLLDEVFAAFTAPTEIQAPSVKDPNRA